MSVDTTSAKSANWSSVTSVAGSVAPSMGEDPVDPKDAMEDSDSEVSKLADAEENEKEIRWDDDCVVVGLSKKKNTFTFTPPSTFCSDAHRQKVLKYQQSLCSMGSPPPVESDTEAGAPTKDQAPAVGSTCAKSWLRSWWS